MEIHYKSNLSAGIASILFAVTLFAMIPSQIGEEYQSVYGITSRSMPYALSILSMAAGIGLIVQSLILKKDNVKTMVVSRELKGIAYMVCLLVYGIAFSKSFVISTIFLGIVTLAFEKCKKTMYYLVVIAVVVALYMIFTQLLHVRLP